MREKLYLFELGDSISIKLSALALELGFKVIISVVFLGPCVLMSRLIDRRILVC